jgi:predicted  nucleic acid-binding Zn-ribbon protein
MSELGKVEREIRQLEVAIYNLKTENNRLHEAIDQVIEDRDAYHEENAELLKDKERLEWLMSMVGWASIREDIDRMMGDEEDDGDLDRLNRDI